MKKMKYVFGLLLVLGIYLCFDKINTNATDYIPLYDQLFDQNTFTVYNNQQVNDINDLYQVLSTGSYYVQEYSNSNGDSSSLNLNYYNCNYDNMTCDFKVVRNRAEGGNYTNEDVKEYNNIAIVIDSNIDQYFEMVQNNKLTINYDSSMFASPDEENNYINNYLSSFSIYDYENNGSTYFYYGRSCFGENQCQLSINRVETSNYFTTRVMKYIIDAVVFDYTEDEFSDTFKLFSSGTVTIKSDTAITSEMIEFPNVNGYSFQVDGNISNNKVFIKLMQCPNNSPCTMIEKHLITLVKDEDIDLDVFETPGFRTAANIKALTPDNDVSSYIYNYFNTLSLYYEETDYNYNYNRLYSPNNETDYVTIRYRKSSKNGNTLDIQYHRIPVNFIGYDNEISQKYSTKVGTSITVNADELTIDTINNALNYEARVLGCNANNTACDIALFDYNTKTVEIHNVEIILDNSISDLFKSTFNLDNNDEMEMIFGNDVSFNFYNWIYYNNYNDATGDSLNYDCQINNNEDGGECRLILRNYSQGKTEIHTVNFSITRSNPTESYSNLVNSEIDIYPGETENIWNRLEYTNNGFAKRDNDYYTRSYRCNKNQSTCSVITKNGDNNIEIHNTIVNIKNGKSPAFSEAFSSDTIELNSIYLDDQDFLYRASQGVLSSKTKSWSYLDSFNNNTARLVFNNLESHTINVVYAEGNQTHKQIVDEVIANIDNDDRVIKAASVLTSDDKTFNKEDTIALDTIVFKVDDLEFINSFYNNISIDAIESGSYNSKIVKDEIESLINNKHISYFYSMDGGLGDGLFEVTGGRLVLYYDGIAYGIANQIIEVAMNHIIYIPDDTANNVEAFIAAAQQRIDDYLGENSGVKIEFLRSLDETLNANQVIDSLEENSSINSEYFKSLDSVEASKNIYFDSTGSDNNVYRITYKDRQSEVMIVKNSSKMKTSTFTASDVNNNINVSSDNALYPSDTLVSSNILDNSISNNILSQIGINNILTVDISLYSPSKGNIEEFDGEEFEVEVPIDTTSISNSNNLYAYYVKDNGEVESHPVVLDDFIAKFETTHFSTYIIAEGNEVEQGDTSEDVNLQFSNDQLSVDFGELYVNFDENITRTITVTNNNEFPITISITNPTASGPFGSIWFDETQEIAPGGSLQIQLIANKSSAFAGVVGNYEGDYTITGHEVGGTKTSSYGIHANVVINPTPVAKVSYTTHVQNVGWQDYVSNGAMAGTSARSLRLEGLKIKLENQEYSGDVIYRTHIQNIGWESSFKSNDEMSGTTGQALRLEAIEIALTGEMAEHYDIYYRVHAQMFGWLGWARNGERAGTAGYAYRLEGIEIKLVPKGEKVEEYGKKVIFYDKSSGELIPVADDAKVSYTTHVQNIGWQSYVQDGRTAGTTGKSLRLEGIKIKLLNPEYSGDIEYRTHIQNIGWESSFKKNDEMSGTSGQSLRLEAIEIRLTGEMAEHYDIYYRVHAQNFGWLGWAKNGEQSGTAGFAYRLEGIEIQVLPKGEKPSNITIGLNAFYQK